MKRFFRYGMVCLSLCAGCFSVKTEHEVAVKPIHITMDINVKVQKDLENFLDLDD
jgi:hypothetical protein